MPSLEQDSLYYAGAFAQSNNTLRYSSHREALSTAMTKPLRSKGTTPRVDPCPEPLRHSRTELDSLVARYANATAHAEIAAFEAYVSEVIELSSSRAMLVRWLEASAPEWVTSRRPALAAVIECAAKAGVNDVANIMDAVLQDEHAHSLVATVAAQRSRWLRISNSDLRRSLGNSVLNWIRRWEQSTDARESAVAAIPSLPPLLHDGATAPLSQWLIRGQLDVAWGAANAVLDWGTNTYPMNEESTNALFDATLERWSAEQKISSPNAPNRDLCSLLLWSIGGITTTANANRAAEVFVQAFRRQRGLEGAGTVRAGRTLAKRLKAAWLEAMDHAFGPEDRHNFYRYTALLIA